MKCRMEYGGPNEVVTTSTHNGNPLILAECQFHSPAHTQSHSYALRLGAPRQRYADASTLQVHPQWCRKRIVYLIKTSISLENCRPQEGSGVG